MESSWSDSRQTVEVNNLRLYAPVIMSYGVFVVGQLSNARNEQ